MKNLFNLAIVLGIIIIVAGAGGYETMSTSFLKSLLIMLSGALLMTVGAVGKEKKIRYCRKNGKYSRKRKNTVELTRKKVCRKAA